MANVTLNGNPVSTNGELPKVGEKAKNFTLVKNDRTKTTLADFAGTKLILNIYPSIDTGTCAKSTVEFNKRAAGLKNTKIICISRDLPFAQKRFCGAEGIDNIMTLSDFVDGSFGRDYGVEITSGSLQHLHSRAIVVIDENGVVKYTEQVADIANEPNYDAALKAVQ